MLAMIGFIVLILIGMALSVLAGIIIYGTALFGGKAYETLIPLALAGFVFWLAFHYAPFHITFTQ